MPRRARFVAALLAVVLTAGAGVVAAAPASAAVLVGRLHGATRYDTAAVISRTAFPEAGSAPVVFVASGETFADSLSVGPVAARLKAPVLLTPRGALHAAARAEITRLAPQKVVIIGAGGAVSADVEAALAALVPEVERIGGVDRYETSRLIVEYGFPEGAETAVIATGGDFPDALSGAALAAHVDAPLILVDGRAAQLGVHARAAVTGVSPSSVIVLGGAGVVSAAVASDVAASTGAQPRRIAGADRYETSALIAAEFADPSRVYVATGRTFPDATAVTPLAAMNGAPVVLSRPLCAPAPTRAALLRASVVSRVLLGGPAVLRGLVGTVEQCLSIVSASSAWVLVNKRNAIRPLTYVPPDLRRVNVPGGGYLMRTQAAAALEQMAAGARAAGVGSIGLASAYRSYSSQAAIHERLIRELGLERALNASARPGYSEHQTGWAADLVACSSAGCGSLDGFGSSAQGRWVAANAHRYGFIVRYLPNRTHITGYLSEPWHLRWVGHALAADYRLSKYTTLEEYLGQPAAPTY